MKHCLFVPDKLPFIRLLKNILDKSLSFISSDDARQFNAEQMASELRQFLTDVHICLEEFRYHEGREQLIKEMAAEVQRINDVKAELERCVCIFYIIDAYFI